MVNYKLDYIFIKNLRFKFTRITIIYHFCLRAHQITDSLEHCKITDSLEHCKITDSLEQ